jgi:FKBP-type peptidyl-prolyl cis-trans isomerase FklB
MKIIKSVLATAVIASMVSCGNQTKQVKSLETELDSVSYAVGLNMAKQMQNGFEEVDEAMFVQGFESGSDTINQLIREKDIQDILNTYFQKKQQAKMRENVKKAEMNKKLGEDFLAENKTKDGVKTTDSGLQYIVLKEGKGKKPTKDDKVKVHYHGTVIDGTVFDSSVDRGEPSTFGVSQVIKGWTEGLQLMKEGAKYKFFIPSELAYGPQDRGQVIKGNSTLIFEVELLEVLK